MYQGDLFSVAPPDARDSEAPPNARDMDNMECIDYAKSYRNRAVQGPDGPITGFPRDFMEHLEDIFERGNLPSFEHTTPDTVGAPADEILDLMKRQGIKGIPVASPREVKSMRESMGLPKTDPNDAKAQFQVQARRVQKGEPIPLWKGPREQRVRTYKSTRNLTVEQEEQLLASMGPLSAYPANAQYVFSKGNRGKSWDREKALKLALVFNDESVGKNGGRRALLNILGDFSQGPPCVGREVVRICMRHLGKRATAHLDDPKLRLSAAQKNTKGNWTSEDCTLYRKEASKMIRTMFQIWKRI